MINLNNEKRKLSLSGASSEPIISAESKRNQPRYSVNCCAIPEYDRFGFGFAKVLAFAFLLSLNLSTAFADYCTCTWSGADNKTLTITNCYNGNLGWSSCTDQKTANNVIIGTGVTSIGTWAFENAGSLKSITIPEGVKSIGAEAFHHTENLTSITIPDSVTSIGDRAFAWNTSLTSITIPEGVTSIGVAAFYNDYNLTSITLPEGLTSIGNSAFGSVDSLTSITIPDSVTSIGDSAFLGAERLTSITIPDSVTSIGDDAFEMADRLTNIMCKGDETSCADTVNAIRAAGYTKNISYPTDKTSCEGSDISLFVWDDINSKCSRRNEAQCNSVAKYYYSDGKCQVLPKTQSACTGTNIEWNATDNKCVNKNYTPTGGDDIGDVSGDFNPADCYNNGQVPYNNQCLDEYPFAKKRWTPAEANEWLHDGNDNFVVITFKK